MAITKNIVTDYGADPTGVVNSKDAFYTGLKPDMAGQDCDLTIPAGTYLISGTGGAVWASGHTSLDVTATGATLAPEVVLGPNNLTPHSGIDDAAGISARIKSVSAGATTIELTAASAAAGHISRANVGRWMMISGFPIQGVFQAAYGFPPNNQFNDHVLITAVDTTNKTITFTPALQNSYSSSWPEFTRGDRTFEIDGAGPATAYFMHADWGAPISYTGGTYTNSQLINVQGRDMTFTGITCDSLPIYPSLNQTFRLYNSTLSGAQVEADKNNDLVDIQGGTHKQWWWQSSSTRMFTMSGVTITQALNGTPRNAVIDNCSMAGLNMGPTAYGRGETFTARNCTITGTIAGGILETGPSDLGMQDCMFMSGGIITLPMCLGDIATRTFVPDSYGRNVNFWSGNSGTFGRFRVLSVTADSWPAADDQTATTNVTMANGSKNVEVSSAIFSAADVGKVIIIPNAISGGLTMKTFITAFTDSTHVTVFSACTLSGGISASSRSLQWGTCNVYVTTDQSGGLPASTLYNSTGKLSIRTAPVRKMYFENCTGSDDVVDFCNAGAQGKPLWSYTKRTYNGSANGGTLKSMGDFVSLKINVTKAYTGAQSTLKAGLNQFNNLPVVVGGAWTTYGPVVNLKVTGERIITVGSTTGAQTGDANLNVSSAMWMSGTAFGIFIGNGSGTALASAVAAEDPSVWPSFTVEIITDQGIASDVPAAVVPLRFRLRA